MRPSNRPETTRSDTTRSDTTRSEPKRTKGKTEAKPAKGKAAKAVAVAGPISSGLGQTGRTQSGKAETGRTETERTETGKAGATRRTVGRRALPESERKTEKLPPIYVTKELEQAIIEAAAAAGKEFSNFGREALESFVNPAPHPALLDSSSLRAKFLTKAPCGPWEEAIEHAGHFTLSPDIADELEAREGDVVVRAVGESMDGAGIHDDTLLLMRPLPDNREPRVGEIALVQVTTEDGEYLGTIKEWRGGTPPLLRDGEGQPYAYPEGLQTVKAVAVARGLIARLV